MFGEVQGRLAIETMGTAFLGTSRRSGLRCFFERGGGDVVYTFDALSPSSCWPFLGRGGALEWFGGGGREWCVVNGPSWRWGMWELYELVSWEMGLRGYLWEGGGE